MSEAIPELKPCPFCERLSITIIPARHANWQAMCAFCGAKGPECGSVRIAALDWNEAPRREAKAGQLREAAKWALRFLEESREACSLNVGHDTAWLNLISDLRKALAEPDEAKAA